MRCAEACKHARHTFVKGFLPVLQTHDPHRCTCQHHALYLRLVQGFGPGVSAVVDGLRPAPQTSSGFGEPVAAGDGSPGGGAGRPPTAGGMEQLDQGGSTSEDGAPGGGSFRPPPPRRGGFEGGFDGPDDAQPPAAPADPLADNGGKRFEGVSRRKQAQQSEEEEEKVRYRVTDACASIAVSHMYCCSLHAHCGTASTLHIP